MDKQQHHEALEAIRKKLVGKKLDYKEIYAIMDQIADDRLGDVLTTYFVASGYSRGFSDRELYYLTKAMVETGEQLHFRGIVADKHSIGGSPGGRITMIVVPIIAAAGFKIPKSSSRAITTPAGTADAMEVLAPVTFNKKQIYEIVGEVGACIVWGGSFKIAPADDEIIRIEEPLLFESFDKVLVSVMAKKVAFGSNHVVIDMPYGKTAKVHTQKDAEEFAAKFVKLGKRFDIKVETLVRRITEPPGYGVGPLLEARDALAVLEQDEYPEHLEDGALDISEILLDLCLKDSPKKLQDHIKKTYGNSRIWAKSMLTTGKAHQKMMEIIKAQGGRATIESRDLKPGKFHKVIPFKRTGTLSSVHNKNISIVCKILGAPGDAKAGMTLERCIGDHVSKGEPAVVLYSSNEHHLKEALDSLELFPLLEVE